MEDDDSPYTPEFQAEALRFLLGSRRAMLNFVDKVQHSFFSDAGHQQLWSLARSHFQKHRSVPTIGVMSEIVRKTYSDDSARHADTRNTLTEAARALYAAPVPTDPLVEATIRDFIGYAAVKECFLAEAEALTAGKFSPDIAEKFRIAARVGLGDADTGWKAKSEAVTAIDRYADPDANAPIPTGLFLLDRELGGGLRRGQMGIFMAPPKGSKSTFLLNVAHNAPTIGVRRNVLYLTLELSEELQALRWAIRTTMVDKTRILQDPDAYRSLYRRRAAAIFSPGHECVIKFFAPYICTPNKIRGLLDTLADQGIVIDEVCLDYLELMGSDTNGEKDYMTQTRITTDLRQIAVDYDLALWTASRTNREAETAVRNGNWIAPHHMSGSYEKLGVIDVAIAGQRYRDGMAIVPIAMRNEGGYHKVACSLVPSKMYIQTLRLIGEEERPEAIVTEEDAQPRRGRGQGGGGGGAAPKRPGSSFSREAPSF